MSIESMRRAANPPGRGTRHSGRGRMLPVIKPGRGTSKVRGRR